MDADIGYGTYIVSFLLLLTPLVFVHELGHFLVGRFFGVKAEVFSIGFGREIFGWTDKKGTRWKVGWLPLGGYVKFFGDAGAASNPSEEVYEMNEEERKLSLFHQPLLARSCVILAGPVTNFIFAILVFAVLFATFGQRHTTPVVYEVATGSGAEVAGIQAGDRILRVAGEDVDSFEQIIRIMSLSQGEPVEVVVSREDADLPLQVQPQNSPTEDRFGNKYDHWLLGVNFRPALSRRAPLESIYYGAEYAYGMTEAMITGVGQIIMGVRSAKEMRGPLGIMQMSGEAALQGPEVFIWLMGLLSLNLGLINLFPIPMLDGGHLLFYLMEAIRGKPVSVAAQEIGYLVGLTLVLALLVFVTWNDLSAFKVF